MIFLKFWLNLDHADEIRATVKRAEKDFQLESTLKTYEEIWLSKTFQMIPYQPKQVRFALFSNFFSSKNRIYLILIVL